MVSLQNVINNIQQIVCSSKLKYKLIDLINNMKYDESVRSSDEVLGEMKQEINRMISKVDPSIGITDSQLAQLKYSLASLIYIIVTVSSVDGKISGRNVKNTFIRIINSFCLDYVAPERMGPRIIVEQANQQAMANEQNMMKAKKPIRKDDVVNVSSELGKDGSTLFITTTYGDGSQTTTTSSLSGEVNSDLSSGKISSISTFGGTSSGKVSEMMSNMASNVSSAMSNMSSTVSSQIASMNSGTRSSMSTFGKSSGSMMFFFVLIIVAVAAYFLYKNKEKLKMPSLSRQISNFGRQIKAVRRM